MDRAFGIERKGWTMSVKLTDGQLEMMSAAAQREDRCLTAPETMNGAALGKTGAKFAKLGLVREIHAKPGAPIWRRDGVDDARAASGPMKGRAKMVVVRATV
jgi:hypothetical protein